MDVCGECVSGCASQRGGRQHLDGVDHGGHVRDGRVVGGHDVAQPEPGVTRWYNTNRIQHTARAHVLTSSSRCLAELPCTGTPGHVDTHGTHGDAQVSA
jgi:hypothetical protein